MGNADKLMNCEGIKDHILAQPIQGLRNITLTIGIKFATSTSQSNDQILFDIALIPIKTLH